MRAKMAKKLVSEILVVGGGILAGLGEGADICNKKGKANTKAQKAKCKKRI